MGGGPPGPSLLVKDLKNGTTYTCSVTATNSVGTGPASAASNSVTAVAPVAPVAAATLLGAPTIGTAQGSVAFTVGPPGAPTIGTATAGNRRVSVAFTRPRSNGGAPITSYVMACSYAGRDVVTGVTNGPASPLQMTNLENGTAYTCKVMARNAAGFDGPVSADSNSVTPVAP